MCDREGVLRSPLSASLFASRLLHRLRKIEDAKRTLWISQRVSFPLRRSFSPTAKYIFAWCNLNRFAIPNKQNFIYFVLFFFSATKEVSLGHIDRSLWPIIMPGFSLMHSSSFCCCNFFCRSEWTIQTWSFGKQSCLVLASLYTHNSILNKRRI